MVHGRHRLDPLRAWRVKLWARARRLPVVVSTLIVILVVGGTVGDRGVALPTLIGSGNGMAMVATLLPLAWAAALADGFAARGQALEGRPTGLGTSPLSRLGLVDATLFLSAVAVAAVSFSTIVVVRGSVLGGVGPVLVLSGVSCVRTLQAGAGQGILAASVLLMITTAYGTTAPGSQFVRLLQPDGDAAWSFVCGLALCSVAWWLLLTNRVTTRLEASERLD